MYILNQPYITKPTYINILLCPLAFHVGTKEKYSEVENPIDMFYLLSSQNFKNWPLRNTLP